MRWLLMVALFLCLCGFAYTSPDPVSPTYQPQQKQQKPDFTLTAPDLLTEVKANVFDAEKKYIGKKIQITGVISRIRRDLNKEPTVEFRYKSMGWRCPVYVTNVEGLKVGDEVTFIATGGTKSGKLALINGTIKK